MSKRWITVMLTALTVLMLTGCNANQKAVTEAADGFLTAIVNNDKEAAAQYASEEFMKSEEVQFMDPQNLSESPTRPMRYRMSRYRRILLPSQQRSRSDTIPTRLPGFPRRRRS